MKIHKTPIALAALAACAALPAAGQSAITMEAEAMTLSSYEVEDKLIKLAIGSSSGTASQSFPGASGHYDIEVHVLAESDGQSTLEVFTGNTLLRRYTYPLSDGLTSFTIGNVALTAGETMELVGRHDQGAMARVDKIVFTPVTSFSGAARLPPRPVSALARVARKVVEDLVALKRAVATPSAPTEPVSTACANPSGGYEGFGRNTTGGAGQPAYRVTNLNDSGSGSLRDALSQGNRCVVFDIGGTISLSSNLLVKGANVTIDGLTAPSPGITLSNSTLVMQGSSGARNVVLRGIRVRGTPVGADAIRVYGTSNVVIDRVSASGAGDGALDVTENSRDVTIQWSILGNGGTSHNVSLIKYETARVTVHHNLYINSENRSPHCGRSDTATSLPAEVVCDVRNNLVWNYYKGTEVRTYGTANVVNNYYYTNNTASSAARTIYKAEGGVAYVSGNHSRNGWSVNSSDRSTPFAAVVPTTTDAITAAREVVAKAGARGPRFGLDAADQSYLGQISLD
jgi:pectate lyase